MAACTNQRELRTKHSSSLRRKDRINRAETCYLWSQVSNRKYTWFVEYSQLARCGACGSEKERGVNTWVLVLVNPKNGSSSRNYIIPGFHSCYTDFIAFFSFTFFFLPLSLSLFCIESRSLRIIFLFKFRDNSYKIKFTPFKAYYSMVFV